ncbi:MAG: hypothetical protein BWY95_00278 [Bacteroidetes bacterium ADurb.BinA104]|jgi:hypothetical protein|nr:MAG: hypothetical protein BWY95_00278 [Bacteroidetes bacterium ADurb.BinA104]
MGDHTYKAKDGRILPSVTTVIGDIKKENFSGWHASLRKKGIDPDWELNRLGDIGTICHYRVLSKISPTPIDEPDMPVRLYPENAMTYADHFEMMWDELGLIVKRATCERKCVDEKKGYCGTFDCAGVVTGEIRDKKHGQVINLRNARCLIDLKTSVEAKEKHFLQLGAYSGFFKEKPEYGLVICLCPYTYDMHSGKPKNPNLIPKVWLLTEKELEKYRREFYKMLKEWWEMQQNPARVRV